MRKDPYAREGYVYIFDYDLCRPIYYTPEEYAHLQAVEERKRQLERLLILEGFLIAFENSDHLVKVIRASSNKTEAKEKLIHTLPLSQKQVSAILKMQLKRFVQMDREETRREYLTLKENLSDH